MNDPHTGEESFWTAAGFYY